MKDTIERERHMTAVVRQLKNDLNDEKVDHEEKVGIRETFHVSAVTIHGALIIAACKGSSCAMCRSMCTCIVIAN